MSYTQISKVDGPTIKLGFRIEDGTPVPIDSETGREIHGWSVCEVRSEKDCITRLTVVCDAHDSDGLPGLWEKKAIGV